MRLIKCYAITGSPNSLKFKPISCICFSKNDREINNEIAKKYPNKFILRWPKEEYSEHEATKELNNSGSREHLHDWMKGVKNGNGVVLFSTTFYLNKP